MHWIVYVVRRRFKNGTLSFDLGVYSLLFFPSFRTKRETLNVDALFSSDIVIRSLSRIKTQTNGKRRYDYCQLKWMTRVSYLHKFEHELIMFGSIAQAGYWRNELFLNTIRWSATGFFFFFVAYGQWLRIIIGSPLHTVFYCIHLR